MISETTFARKFTSFWTQLLPNEKNYIRLINGGMVQSLHHPEEPARADNVALCNMLAFELFKGIVNGNLSKSDLRNSTVFKTKLYSALVETCSKRLSRFLHGKSMSLPLNNDEIIDIRAVSIHMLEYLPPGMATIKFSPHFQGLGFLNEAEGDILFEKNLIEVKSGYRSFSVTDIRQVLVYLTLNYFSFEPKNIGKIELYNPRMGSVFEVDVDVLCDDISALQPADLFNEILLFVTENTFIELPET